MFTVESKDIIKLKLYEYSSIKEALNLFLLHPFLTASDLLHFCKFFARLKTYLQLEFLSIFAQIPGSELQKHNFILNFYAAAEIGFLFVAVTDPSANLILRF